MKSSKQSRSPIIPPNIFSRLCLSWVFGLLRRNRDNGVIELNDLNQLSYRFVSCKLSEQLKANWLKENKHTSKKPNLTCVALRTMGWEPLFIGLLLILNELARMAQPLLLINLMDFFESCSTMSTQSAFLFIGAIIFAALCGSFFYHSYFYLIQIFGIRMRNAYTNLIVGKITRLSSQSINQIGSGNINNLVSNDASQIEWTLLFINYLWVAPIELIIVTIIFWHFVKYVAFIPIIYVLIILAIQIYTSHCSVNSQNKIWSLADKRIKLVSEVIKSMVTVKMHCLESLFITKIFRLRKKEINANFSLSMVVCLPKLLSHSFVPVTFLLMYIAMWFLNIPFNTKFFVTAICILTYVRLSIVDFLNFAIQGVSKYLVANKRIEKFLLLDDSKRNTYLACLTANEDGIEDSLDHDDQTIPLLTINQTSLELRCNIRSTKWNKDSLFELKNIMFNAHPGDLICITGPVASGKTCLLQSLLGEVECFDGELQMPGSICYVPQQPWIFPSTIRKNICFGAKYDKELMKRVIKATELNIDLKQFPDRLDTLVGDQGIMLSGGQKARIDLARALYRNGDTYILDDPFSALDAHVSKHVFHHVIKTYLNNKICILTTHRIEFLKNATKILALDKGNMVVFGTYDELSKIPSLSYLVDIKNIHVQQDDKYVVPYRRLSSVTESISSITSDEEELLLSKIHVETQEQGRVTWRVYAAYLKAGLGLIPALLLLIGFFSMQQGITIFSNWQLAKWSSDESSRHPLLLNCSNLIIEKHNPIRNMSNNQWNVHQNKNFYIYLGIVAILFVISVLRIILTDFMLLNAARVLHNRMFRQIIYCPIHFFYSNLGQILNRFTKDFSTIDSQLPSTFFDFFYCLFQVLGAVSFVSVLNPYSLIPAILAGICMLFLRHYFAQDSRDLKRLEGISRSPVLSHLASTIQGLPIIRSYCAEEICLKEFWSHLEKNTRVKYSSMTTDQWAGIRFDWISLSFTVLVVLSAMVIHIFYEHFSAINIALTLTYSLNLVGLFQWTIRQSVQVDNQMTAVERVLQYISLDHESGIIGNNIPPKNWPCKGEITFENVCMKHLPGENALLALKNISFTIRAGEKVGIVGRTGAGKSSIVETLFRMGFLTDGRVTIDGIDTATISSKDVRRCISVISQAPTLFSGTLRSNLDPFGSYSDTEILAALERIQFKTHVMKNMPHGLDSIVEENGANICVGEKQLICLARAFFKRDKILVIDEGTANVDNATDAIVQNAIQLHFNNCTILTIAHRLRTINNSDRIMVLGEGRLLEFDTPQNLHNNSNSRFYSLLNETHSTESSNLQTISEGDNHINNA